MGAKERQVRRGVAVFMAFALALSLAYLFLLAGAFWSFFRPGALEWRLSSSGYYGYLQEEIREVLGYRGAPFGIPEEVLSGLVPLSQLKEDVLQSARGNPISGEALEKGVEEALLQYLNVEGIPYGEAQKEAVDEFRTLSGAEYRTLASSPYLSLWWEARGALWGYVLAGIAVAVAGTVFFAQFVYRLYRHPRVLRFFGYAVTGAGLMVLVLPAYALLEGSFRGLQVAPESAFILVQSALSAFFYLLAVAGGLLILLGVILQVQGYRIMKRPVKMQKGAETLAEEEGQEA